MKNVNEKKFRQIGSVASPVTFGMAGVIYTNAGGRNQHDESWLTSLFRVTPQTERHEWRSEDMTIVSCQHVAETGADAGKFDHKVPTDGPLQGLVFGQFFGTAGNERQPDILTRSVLASYLKSGPSGLCDLNGLWAAVVWDSVKREAIFARDPIGGQTLYAAQLDGRIVFATDLRAVSAEGTLRAVDEDAVAQFLHYFYVPAPRTLIQGCHAVLPGFVLSMGLAVKQEKFAVSRFVRGVTLGDEKEVQHELERRLPEFEERLLTAVSDCLPERGRIVLTLSGGKDSSVLAVALSKLCPERVLAFTVGHGDERMSEVHDASRVCQALGLEHQYYIPTEKDIAQGVMDFARAQDQPVGDLAALPYFLGMARLPDDCAVLIDGTGNDYYFGIPSYDKGLRKFKRRMDIQAAVGPFWPVVLKAMSFGPEGLRRLSQFWRRPAEESFVAWEGWSRDELEQLFGRKISFEDTYLWQVMREADPSDWLTLLTEVVCRIWEPHAAYRKAVHFAHALGKSIRFPFTDNRLANFVQSLPEELKYRNGLNKIILREYMMKNLPREITEKPKSGFTFDLNPLFVNPYYPWQDDLYRTGHLHCLPAWQQQPIQELLKKWEQSPGDPRWQQRLYALCLLATVLAVREGYDPFARSPAKDPTNTIH